MSTNDMNLNFTHLISDQERRQGSAQDMTNIVWLLVLAIYTYRTYNSIENKLMIM